MLTSKFAQLPNDIIREIAQYTGLKNRNGKYMVQIPKDDLRYKIVSNLPIKHIYSILEYPMDFLSCVTLTSPDNQNNSIYLDVSTFIWGEEHFINYNLFVVNKKNLGDRRIYHYRYV